MKISQIKQLDEDVRFLGKLSLFMLPFAIVGAGYVAMWSWEKVSQPINWVLGIESRLRNAEERHNVTQENTTVVVWDGTKNPAQYIPSCALEESWQIKKGIPCDDFSTPQHLNVRFPTEKNGIYGEDY